MRFVCAAIGLVFLAACEPGVPLAGGDAAEGSDTCDARAQRSLVGTVVDDLAAISAAAPKVRLIFPGDAVTQDLQPERLNVVFDGDQRVTRVYCG